MRSARRSIRSTICRSKSAARKPCAGSRSSSSSSRSSPRSGANISGGCSRSACLAGSAACPAPSSARCCSASSRASRRRSTAPLGRRPSRSASCCSRWRSGRPASSDDRADTVSSGKFILITLAVAAAVFAAAQLVSNNYLFFAGYVVLQFVVLATAWNILGGYCGYVNFGSAAFFAVGGYSSVVRHKTDQLPLPLLILLAGAVAGFVGLGMGYLSLRLRGSFFALATLALAVVLQTLVVNWDYVGGSRGAYIIRPNEIAFIGPYIQYLFLLMLALAVIALTIARGIERSQLGYGFATIRDDELAAEASGVPTLRLKLVATTMSGALMGMAGAPFPYYIGYLQPSSAFDIAYAVNSIAMPMIGGTTSWVGPLIGAILLGSLQQIATVTISSAVNLLFVGLLLVAFVIIAPNGIVGLVQGWMRGRTK